MLATRNRGAHLATAMLNARMTQPKRILLWLMLTALAALVTYFGIRGYLSPELLLNFSNTFTC
jgi:cytochrome c oxidase subunit IV